LDRRLFGADNTQRAIPMHHCSPSSNRRFLSVGMDFFAVMGRPGLRVSRRRIAKSTVGAPHRITKADSQKWFKQKVS
jgi:hypothetical protein